MSLSSRLITLSAIVTLSCGISACSDDSSPSIPDDAECTVDACAADGHTLNQCTDGKIVPQDCADSGKICSNGACVNSDEDPDDSKCTEDVCLDETTLNKCHEGKFIKQDCSKSGKICSNNACVKKTEEPINPACTADVCDSDGITLLKCNDGTIEEIDCSLDNDQICSNNACAPKVDPEPECTADACDTDGITLLKCNDGTIEEIDCSLDNDQICSNNACAPKVDPEPSECTADACDTDGITLLKCKDGVIEKVDCSQDNDQICSNNACAPKGTEPVECTADACDTDGITLLKCNDGTVEKIDCSQDNDQICSNNACAPKTVEPPECDPNAEATCDGNTLVTCTPEGKEKRIDCEAEKKICDPTAHECIAPIEGSSVGMPCTCTGDSCNTIIKGNELNNTLGSMVMLFAGSFGSSDSLTVPNFFGKSSEISGCEALAAEIPEGMALGCFRDSKLTATSGFISTAKSFMNYVKGQSENLANWGMKFIEKVEENVKLDVPNGYCFVGALDAHLVFSQSSGLIGAALSNKGADLVKLANDKFDTGDIEKAKTATCPEGSVLINDIHKTTTIAGYGQDGSDKTAFSMAMCLKSCESDSDCRTSEGYSCVEWHEKKVCFYKATIDAIHELEASLDVK